MDRIQKELFANKKDSNVIVKVSKEYKYPIGCLLRSDKKADAINKAQKDFLEDVRAIDYDNIAKFVKIEIIEKGFVRKPEHVENERKLTVQGREYIGAYIGLLTKLEAEKQFGVIDSTQNPDIFDKQYADVKYDENENPIVDEDSDFTYVLSDRVEEYMFNRTRYYTNIVYRLDETIQR